MMAKPLRALELHYPMIQFLIILIYTSSHSGGQIRSFKNSMYLNCAINFGTVVIKGDFLKREKNLSLTFHTPVIRFLHQQAQMTR